MARLKETSVVRWFDDFHIYLHLLISNMTSDGSVPDESYAPEEEVDVVAVEPPDEEDSNSMSGQDEGATGMFDAESEAMRGDPVKDQNPDIKPPYSYVALITVDLFPTP